MDSIFLQNRITFSGRYENRITQNKLDSLKRRIIQPYTEKEVKKALQKKSEMELSLYLKEYTIEVSNDTLKANFLSNAYTFVQICEKLRK